MQPLLHANQLLDFAFHQPADRDVRPLRDDLGDVFLVHFFLEQGLPACWLAALRSFFSELALELRAP